MSLKKIKSSIQINKIHHLNNNQQTDSSKTILDNTQGIGEPYSLSVTSQGLCYVTTSNSTQFSWNSGKWNFSIITKNGTFMSHVTLKFDGWLWKTIGHIIYASSSFVYHFVGICEFKLELWSRNTQSGTKFILIPVTLTFDLLHEHHFCQWY